MSDAPFFVLGCPRSGTSWFGDVLDAHPRLMCGMELDLITAFGEVRRLRAAHGSVERLKAGPARVRGGATELAAMHLRDIVLWELRESGKARFGDKTPSYALNMNVLDAIFPSCQFVHIIRDGRDNVSSLLQSESTRRHWRTEGWVPRTVESAAHYWVEHVGRAQATGAAVGPSRYIEVRYEDLMADPLGQGRRVLRFLGEEVTPEVEAKLRTAQRKSPRWHERLSPSELRRFHAVPQVSALIEALGYAPYTTPDPGPAVADAAAARAAGARAAGALDEAAALIDAAAQAGADSAALWAELARIEAARGRPAVAAQLRVRVLRSYPFDPTVCSELLAQHDLPDSVFGLTAALAGGVGPLRAAIEAFLRARGLDPAAAKAVAQALPEPRRPGQGANVMAPVGRLRVALRGGDPAQLQRAAAAVAPLLRSPATAAEAQGVLLELGLQREDPQWVRHALDLAATGRLDALLRLAGLPSAPASGGALAAALLRVELPSVQEGVFTALRARGLDDDAANALTARLSQQRAQWLQP